MKNVGIVLFVSILFSNSPIFFVAKRLGNCLERKVSLFVTKKVGTCEIHDSKIEFSRFGILITLDISILYTREGDISLSWVSTNIIV